jgi:hypothetical protein
VFIHSNFFQVDLIFVSQAGRLNLESGYVWCSTWVGTSLTRKYLTNLKKLALDKRFSLFCNSVGGAEKKFKNFCQQKKIN